MEKITLILFLLTSCASPNFIDERAKPYVKKFERLYGRDIGPIDIFITKFDDEWKRAGGLCRIIDQQIFLNEYFWNKKDKYEKEMVVFHELGHCELGVAHDYQNRNKFRCFNSIMNWQSMPGQCYKDRLKYYRDELFKRERKYRWRILRSRQRRDF